MSWHEWLACLCAAPSAAAGVDLLLSGIPWGGCFFIGFALLIRYWVMGFDLKD